MIISSRHLITAVAVVLGACGSCDGPETASPTPAAQGGAALPEPGPDGERIWNGDPELPGVERVDPALVRTTAEALRNKGEDYEPRTHHLEEDGSPEYTNRLILQSSPYLLQHAHNPVNWFSWGREAFERAQSEDKPILLSVGYSTCHWCHVMERESFEDEEIARYMNENFICIKVDREERPDIDDLYMTAVHMLAGRGGWPMTVVMTPSREPFFGGTYFPPRDGARGARKGFLTILRELSGRYRTDRDGVVAQARELSRRLRQQAEPAPPAGVPGSEALERAAHQLASSFDPVDGGFGGAPKFPQPSRTAMLLRYHRRTNDAAALQMVEHTLERMAAGGIHDHVGGGFHRYSVDGRWLVPHFEKMLYDNAQLAVVYLEGWQASGNARLRDVAVGILDYVAREMTSPEGGFYSATDADSARPDGHLEEGWFFTWTPDEVRAVLGPERTRLVTAYYGLTPRGNFEGRTILHEARPLESVAAELSMPPAELAEALAAARRDLYVARSRRPPPLRDDKILVSWNGLMISAFAKGALVLGEERYARQAEGAASMLLERLRGEDGRLRRSYANGEAQHNAYLEDYAFLIAALLDLYDATSEPRWVREALALQRVLDAHYADDERGGYFQTSHDHEELLARSKPSSDGAVPSGNSVALLNLLRLAEITGDDAWREKAGRGLSAFGALLRRRPTSSPAMLAALDWQLDVPLEIVVIEPNGGEADAGPLLDELRRVFLPNRLIATLSEEDAASQSSLVPVLEGKVAIDGRSTAYVCERGHCELPTDQPEVFARQIGRVRPLDSARAPRPLAIPAPGETPEPWSYDADTDRHWHPGHRHWHDGRPPPAGAR